VATRCPASGLLGVGPRPYAWGGVANNEDLGISRCMGEKSRALFCPVSLRPTYP